MGPDELFELPRADVLALADDDVLPPARDAKVARGVDGAEVTGAEPSLAREGVGVERRVPVPEETLRAARQNLPLATGRHRSLFLVHDQDLVRAEGPALAIDPALGGIVGTGRRPRGELGRAVHPLRDAAEAGCGLADERGVDVGPAAREEPKR